MSVEKEVVGFLSQLGFYDVILPFVLGAGVTFGLLSRTMVLGTEWDGKTPKNQLNAVVALVVGLIAVVAWGQSATFTLLLQVLLYMTLTFFALFFAAGAFLENSWRSDRMTKIAIGVVGAIVVGIVFRVYDYVRGGELMIVGVLALLSAIVAVGYVFSDSSPSPAKPKEAKAPAAAPTKIKSWREALEELSALPPEEQRAALPKILKTVSPEEKDKILANLIGASGEEE